MSAGLSEHVAAIPTAGTASPESPFTDEELTALALAADPDEPLAAGAMPDPLYIRRGNLPMFYLPPASAGALSTSKARITVALILVAAFLTITALGFCATYGQLGPA